jgi:hypothetical protein
MTGATERKSDSTQGKTVWLKALSHATVVAELGRRSVGGVEGLRGFNNVMGHPHGQRARALGEWVKPGEQAWGRIGRPCPSTHVAPQTVRAEGPSADGWIEDGLAWLTAVLQLVADERRLR